MDSRQPSEKLMHFAKERFSKFRLGGEFLRIHEDMNGLHELDPLID